VSDAAAIVTAILALVVLVPNRFWAMRLADKAEQVAAIRLLLIVICTGTIVTMAIQLIT